MAREQKAKPRTRSARTNAGAWLQHLSQRQSARESALITFPLFLFYQIGILFSDVKNGADLVTTSLIRLCEAQLELYVAILALAAFVYTIVLGVQIRRGGWGRPQVFATFLEAGVYALSLGSIILLVMQELSGFLPGLALAENSRSLLDIAVISSGAGVHEELAFRVIGLGLLTRLFALRTSPRAAWMSAWILSSLAFSLAHHIGPMGEAFTVSAFVFRVLAGMAFGLIYQWRGAGVAIWTHALYDVYVLSAMPIAG